MLITPAASIRSSEITDKRLYVNRRTFIRSVTGATLATAGAMLGAEGLVQAAEAAPHGRKLASVTASPYSTDERANTWEQVTTYTSLSKNEKRCARAPLPRWCRPGICLDRKVVCHVASGLRARGRRV